MPKLKNKKAITKRFRITRSGKVLFRASGINHFMAKKGGTVKGRKKQWRELSGEYAKEIKRLVPYL